MTFLALGLVVPLGRRLGVEYGVLTLTLVGPPLFAGGFVTMGRFIAPVFPLFIYSATLSWPALLYLALPVSAALQALVAALHFVGKPVY